MIVVTDTPPRGPAALTLGDDYNPLFAEIAPCAETDPEIFFPEKGGSTREAKAICNGDPRCVSCGHTHPAQNCVAVRCQCPEALYAPRVRVCPVVMSCLAAALDRQEPYGIMGGMSERERRAYRRLTTLTGEVISPRVFRAIAGYSVPLTDEEKVEAATLLFRQGSPTARQLRHLKMEPEKLAAIRREATGVAA